MGNIYYVTYQRLYFECMPVIIINKSLSLSLPYPHLKIVSTTKTLLNLLPGGLLEGLRLYVDGLRFRSSTNICHLGQHLLYILHGHTIGLQHLAMQHNTNT